jgi:hypothetical protein
MIQCLTLPSTRERETVEELPGALGKLRSGIQKVVVERTILADRENEFFLSPFASFSYPLPVFVTRGLSPFLLFEVVGD